MTRKKGIKCPWCGKDNVPHKDGRIGSHLGTGGVRCVGQGQEIAYLPTGRTPPPPPNKKRMTK